MDTLRTAYRGYHVYLVRQPAGWSFSAQPKSSEVPILPGSPFSYFASIEIANAEARNRIDTAMAL
jgi:hypothetical protein